MNTVGIWIQNTAWWGNPLIEVSTNGSWYQDTNMSSNLPNTGWVTLQMKRISIVQ